MGASLARIACCALLAASFPLFASAADPKTTKIDGVTVSQTTADIMKGGCEANPYDALRPYVSGNAKVVPTNAGGQLRDGIDPALACRVSKMLAAASQRGCQPRITSGYRSAALQQSMCGSGRTGCAPAGTSCHQYGLAVDINASCLQWLRQVAPQFKLIQNPIPGDPYHFQCAEHRGASRRSCNRPCDGSVAITPDLNTLNSTSMVGGPPSSGLTSGLRNALGMNQQPPPPPQQPMSQQTQPTQYFPTEQPKTPTPIPPPTSPTSTTATSTATTSSTAEGDTYDENLIEYQPSVADKLLELAYGTQKGSDVATGSTIVIGGEDITELTAPPTSTEIVPSHDAASLVPHPSDTFTSPDLAFYGDPPVADATGFAGAFVTLEILIRDILAILQPMGFRGALLEETHIHE